MEVGPGQGHVAQRRHLEGEAVLLLPGDCEPPGVLLVRVGRVLAQVGEQAAAHQRAVVAGDAVQPHEQFQPPQLRLAECAVVAAKKVVEAIPGDEGALEGGDGLAQVGEGQGFGRIGKGRCEGLGIARQRPQLVHHRRRVRHAHLDGIEDRLAGLRGQVGRATVPELGDLPAGVEHRRRVAGAELPAGAGGGGQVVHTGRPVEAVAAAAGLGVVDRQSRLVEQPAPQLDADGRVVLRARHGRRQRLDVAQRLAPQPPGILGGQRLGHHHHRQQRRCRGAEGTDSHGRLHGSGRSAHGAGFRTCRPGARGCG